MTWHGNGVTWRSPHFFSFSFFFLRTKYWDAVTVDVKNLGSLGKTLENVCNHDQKNKIMEGLKISQQVAMCIVFRYIAFSVCHQMKEVLSSNRFFKHRSMPEGGKKASFRIRRSAPRRDPGPGAAKQPDRWTNCIDISSGRRPPLFSPDHYVALGLANFLMTCPIHTPADHCQEEREKNKKRRKKNKKRCRLLKPHPLPPQMMPSSSTTSALKSSARPASASCAAPRKAITSPSRAR